MANKAFQYSKLSSIVMLLLLQGQIVLSNPMPQNHQVPQVGSPISPTLAIGVSQLVADVVNTGLRTATSLLATGSETAQTITTTIGRNVVPTIINATQSLPRPEQIPSDRTDRSFRLHQEKTQVKRQTYSQTNPEFLDGMTDLITALLTTGLRSVNALINSGAEATQKVAVAVGSSALPSMLNVTRSFSRVQQSSRDIMNNSLPLLPEPASVVEMTRRVIVGVQPAVKVLSETVNKTISDGASGGGLFGIFRGGSSSGSSSVPQVNPNDRDIPDSIDDY